MGDKKAEWSDYAYDNDSISKRLGISKDEVKKLKSEAEKKSKETSEGVPSPNNGIGIGVSIDTNDLANSGLRVGLKVPGLGIEYDTNGEGSIDLVNLIKIETIRKDCFYIQRFYFAGQFLYSDIQKVDSEECNKEPEPEPKPEPEPEPKPDPGFTRPKTITGSKTKQVRKIVFCKRTFYTIEYKYTDKKWNFVSERSTIREPKFKAYDNKKSKLYYEIDNRIVELDFFTHIVSPDQNPETGGYVYITSKYAIVSYLAGSEYDVNYFIEYSFNYMNKGVWPWFVARDSRGGIGWIIDQSSWKPEFDLLKPSPPAGEPDEFYYYVNTFLYRETVQRKVAIIDIDNIVENPTKNPPLPLQPEKKMEKECCDKPEKLLKKLAKYLGLGQSIKPIDVKDNKIEEKGGDDIFPLKVPKRWIDRESKPKDDYEIKNMRHLILSIGVMLDRFEELFNPAGKDKGFPLKKPEEGLWKWLPGDGGDYEVPDPDYDPKKSKEDGKIKSKKLKIETYLDLFRYFLESQIRLEMLFPIAQIRDSKISKRLIYPKAPGEIQINDLIQFQELMFLFINKTLGDPASAVIIKDADPTQEGAQPVTIENFDISDMLRKLIRFSVDINSDIDLTNNFSKRTLYQLLSAMQVLVKNHEMTEAIFEDLGMKEEQVFVPVKFFADPYAGAWKAGEGFDPKKVKLENTEAGIEENLQAFLQEKEVDVKVSRRAKDETTDLRDLLGQIGRYAAELAAQGKIPNTPEAIQQAIDKARFEIQTESALRRTDVRQASAAGRVRTKRNKPKNNKRR